MLSSEESSSFDMIVEEHEDDCGLSMHKLIEKQPSRSLTYNKGFISFGF